jgi:hypothetical protein
LLSFVSEAALERQTLFLEHRLWQPTKHDETRQLVALVIKLGRLCCACNKMKKEKEIRKSTSDPVVLWTRLSAPSL